jgi:hypothetical protein
MNDLALKTLEPRELRLNTISLRGFYGKKLRKGSGGGSSDGFPQLPGDVTRWHFGGLTNEMMAAMDDPRIEDADGKGRFLSFKNFAWSGMSGVNGYKFDFLLNEWVINNNQVSEKYSYKIVINNKENSVQLYNRINLGHIKITLKITGIEINKSTFRVYDNAGTEHKQDYTKDGIYEIDYTANEGANIIYFYVFGGNMGQLENPITIEQLPLYPGFILGDGVDDFAVTEKELNFEDTYTVYTAFIPFQNNPTRNMFLCGADSKKTFTMQYSSLVYVSFIAGNNYYINADFVNGLNLFACKRNGNNICIKNLLTNKVVTGTCGDWVENAGLYYLWKNATYASFAKAAIAGQTICNGYFSTDEDDEKVLDWYKKQYPWLFPDQAWTVTGKTNEDKDRATIANITGNGNDLVLSNFGFIEGSGYNEEGEYAGYLVTDGVDDEIISAKLIQFADKFTIVGDWKFMEDRNDNAGLLKANQIYIYNATTGMRIYLKQGSKNYPFSCKKINALTSDGWVYDEKWDKYKVYPIGSDIDISSRLFLGFYSSNFTKIALKNLGIYNDQLLSKDDCIKAYNYLQTLKAK